MAINTNDLACIVEYSLSNYMNSIILEFQYRKYEQVQLTDYHAGAHVISAPNDLNIKFKFSI